MPASVFAGWSSPTREVPVDEVVWPFAGICDGAARFGTEVQMKFMPVIAVKDLARAWTIAKTDDRIVAGAAFTTEEETR